MPFVLISRQSVVVLTLSGRSETHNMFLFNMRSRNTVQQQRRYSVKPPGSKSTEKTNQTSEAHTKTVGGPGDYDHA